jgi:hypothetical protein
LISLDETPLINNPHLDEIAKRSPVEIKDILNLVNDLSEIFMEIKNDDYLA